MYYVRVGDLEGAGGFKEPSGGPGTLREDTDSSVQR